MFVRQDAQDHKVAGIKVLMDVFTSVNINFEKIPHSK